jgi:phosphoglucan,water dikinase
MIYIGNQTSCWAATPRAPFDFAVASGFDAFEWFPDKKPGAGWDESDLNAAQRRHIRETARACGMRLSVHARWQANPLQPESAALFAKDIELARDLGAALLNIHLYHECGISAFVEAIRPLMRLTAETGLQLAIENTPHHSPEDFNELFTQLHRLEPQLAGHLGMCLDLGHANLCAATRNDYLKFLDRLAPQVPVIHLHLHENWGDADTHLPLFTGPAGRDDSGVRGLISRLRQRNFSGSVILEQWPNPPSLLNQARDRLVQMLDAGAPQQRAAGILPAEPSESLASAIPPHAVANKIVEGDRRCRSWREKLDFIREILADETTPLAVEQLMDIAIYLRFLGTGEIPCVEDGRHFRPAHHARIALQIHERLAALSMPETTFIIRKIYPWLPSSAPEFQRAEPLTRIRDIAHRNDIPSELKREIKTTLQNKLHRCAGPEDLVAATALLERITASDASYSPEFVEQFRVFHRELKEFFNASSLGERLQALLPAVGGKVSQLIREFLAAKSQDAPAGHLAAFAALTELRRCLAGEIDRAPALERAEFVQAEIALEDFAFALLSEIINELEAAGVGARWETLLGVMRQAMANLELSGVEPEESRATGAELDAWRTDFDAADRGQLLRLKATVGRARRLAEHFGDRIQALFPQRAQVLGGALGVDGNAVKIFAEAEIRRHLVFQLSKLSSTLLRHIRGCLGLPPWDVVVSGEVAGRIKLADQLDRKFFEPTIVLLQKAEGDEEIPSGVAGIVLEHDLPHLSHLGVRARQAGVVLVTGEDPAQISELKQLEGKTVLLSASAEKVSWQPAESVGITASRVRKTQIPQVRLLPETACIPLEQAQADRGGHKADGVRRLAELAQKPDAGFKIPAAVVVPFGVMDQALRRSPKIEAEYQRILKQINTASDGLGAAAKHLRELIAQLEVPAEVSAAVAAKFSRHARLMVRSSANDEDLQNLAGAGLHESVANVLPDEAAEAVREVWASLWTKRATLSRQQAGIPQAQAHMAVLIQQMLVPDFSFILHTVNPINRNRRETYAEIVVGLGETLASAAARGNPYRLVCDKHSGAVETLAFANFSQALWPNPDGGVMAKIVDYSRVPLSLDRLAREDFGKKLAAVAQLVETAFGEAQDIEGVVKGGEIYLVQSRPQQGLEQ